MNVLRQQSLARRRDLIRKMSDTFFAQQPPGRWWNRFATSRSVRGTIALCGKSLRRICWCRIAGGGFCSWTRSVTMALYLFDTVGDIHRADFCANWQNRIDICHPASDRADVGRFDFANRLVGFDYENGFIFFYGITRLLQQFDQSSFLKTFTELRNFDRNYRHQICIMFLGTCIFYRRNSFALNKTRRCRTQCRV